MSVQRWKPSWAQGRMIPAGVHPVDGYVSAADHARVVAEMERAHAAALADANLRWDAEVTRALDEGEKIGRLYGSTPRTLTADDPEPAVGAVVLLAVGNEAVQRSALGWQGYAMHTMQWAEMFRFGPVTLIHDGEATP